MRREDLGFTGLKTENSTRIRDSSVFDDDHFQSEDIVEQVAFALHGEALHGGVGDAREGKAEFVPDDVDGKAADASGVGAFEGIGHPQDGGELLERKGKGRTFYGCSNYPACGFTISRRPLPVLCPECEGLLVAAGRDQAHCTNCAYRGPVPEEEAVGAA